MILRLFQLHRCSGVNRCDGYVLFAVIGPVHINKLRIIKDLSQVSW